MEKQHSGTGFGILALVIGLLFAVLPNVFSNAIGSTISQILLSGFGVIVMLVGSIVLIITRLYQKTSASEAFVRTGMGGAKPIIDAGALVIPVVHKVVLVSLETMRLDVQRTGGDALITGDNLRADVCSEFYINVQKNEQDVLSAATSLGERSVNPDSVKSLVEQKLISALRTVGATKPLNELHTRRDEFAAAVQAIVVKDLTANGLTLESVTISKLDQTPPDDMHADTNVFDAQGLKTIAKIVQGQRVERNEILRDADKKVKAQDVDMKKFVYTEEVGRATAEADQDKDIEKAKADAKQKADTFRSQQEEIAGVAEIKKNEGIQVANVEKDQAVKVALQLQEEKEKVAEVAKEQAVDVADREKEITVAKKETDLATAEEERNVAEAGAEKAKQDVLTVTVVQTAERDKQNVVIAKQADVEKEKIEEFMKADVKKYDMVTVSAGEKEAAVNKADAIRVDADAKKDAKIATAEGDQAIQMVPVEVERELVTVRDADVEVTGKELKYKADFQEISKELEIALATIGADKETRIAAAKAMGDALSKADMTVWGDPSTVDKMARSFYGGQKVSYAIEGLLEGLPNGKPGDSSHLINGAGQIVSGLLSKLGVKIDPALMTKSIKKVAEESKDKTEKSAEA